MGKAKRLLAGLLVLLLSVMDLSLTGMEDWEANETLISGDYEYEVNEDGESVMIVCLNVM